MTVPILTAVLSDPIQIWAGLLLFSVALTTVPVFFGAIQSLIPKIIYFTLYLYFQFKEFLLPSEETIASLEVNLHRNFSHDEHVSAHDVPESTIDKILNIINLLFIKWKWPKLLSIDWNLSGDVGYDIKHKFKSLFFILAAIGAGLACFAPGFMNPLGLGWLLNQLASFGIKEYLINYTAVIITGGVIYSLRAPLVTIALGIKSLMQQGLKYWGYSPLSDRVEHTEVVKKSGSTHQFKLKLKLDSMPDTRPNTEGTGEEDEERAVSIPIRCDQCQTSIYVVPHLTLYSANESRTPAATERRISRPEEGKRIEQGSEPGHKLNP